MAAITASMVGALRAKTDAPMMECKKALTEADGDMDRAEEILRVKLGSKASKASSRIAAEGVVAAAVYGNVGALVELNCETDFVTKNDSFLAFSHALAELVAKQAPADVAALSALPLSLEGFGPTVEDVRKGLIGKIGENMSVRRFQRYAGGGRDRQLPARHPDRRAGAVRGRRDRGQGRGDARRGDEAQGADHRRRRQVADRRRALGRDPARRRGRREGQGRRQAGAVAGDRRPAGSRGRSPSS